MKDAHIKHADKALTSWGERVIQDMSSGLGYPNASVEGRVKRDGIGRSSRPNKSVVPRAVLWTPQDAQINSAINQMPPDLRSVVRRHYVEMVIDRSLVADRAHYSGLREARIWISGWMAAWVDTSH